MSFIKELQKKKKELKTCDTVVTSTSGRKYVEKRTETGELEWKELVERTHGFVVDEKQDLQLAQVLDFLYLSSQDPAHDGDLLDKNGITHVISVGVIIPKCARCCNVSYTSIDLLDEPEAGLGEVLDSCFAIIDRIRTSGKGKVLVHCNAGYSRAPSVVIAYLMKSFEYTLEEALDLVRKKRNVKPNDGFMKQLKKFERSVGRV